MAEVLTRRPRFSRESPKHLFHGIRLALSFSPWLQNPSPPHTSFPSLIRSVNNWLRTLPYLKPVLVYQKLISELGITGGDNRKIGYYAGLIVGLATFANMLPYSSLARNPSSSSRRLSRRGNGAGYLILSVAVPSFYLVFSVSACPALPLVYRGRSSRSSSGQ